MKNSRLYALDFSRGFAALAVVLYHWKHFFYVDGKLPETFGLSTLPLFDYLYLFYEYGWAAVDYFFVASGFIFFWLYSKRISEGLTNFHQFMILRVSRLYPLHFLTLCLVATLQIASMRINGDYFVYQYNDAYHFILNVFFASHWGFQSGDSFNGPIWSVSVEILAYILFFASCIAIKNEKNRIAIFIAISFLIYASGINPTVSKGLVLFFTGCATYKITESILNKGRTHLFPVLALLISSWLFLIVILHPETKETIITTCSTIRNCPSLFGVVSRVYTSFWLFPLTVFGLVYLERNGFLQLKKFGWIGNISYSSYLLHFPMQLLAFNICTIFKINVQIFTNGWTIIGFYAALIIISLTSYKYLELPAQAIIRNFGMPSKAVKS